MAKIIQYFRITIRLTDLFLKRTAGIFLFTILFSSAFSQSENIAVKGIIDLRNREWSSNGIADLSGDWEFYWNALYTPGSFDSGKIKPYKYAKVPGFWNSLIP